MLLSPLGKGPGPSFVLTWIPFIEECFSPNLVEIDPVVLEKKTMSKVYDNDGQRINCDQKAYLCLQLRWAKKLFSYLGLLILSLMIKEDYLLQSEWNPIWSKNYWSIEHIRSCIKIRLSHEMYNINKWDLMMSGPASLAVISFIKNWHKKLRLLVDLRIFSKFQGA